MFAAYTEASQQAVNNLRSTADFRWYIVILLALVIYVYIVEIERKRWDIVLTAFGFFCAELVWEMFNALVLHISNRSAMWTTPGDTAYLIFVGLTIEISMMFAVAGVGFLKLLPEDGKSKILGLPNRLFYAIVFGGFCVFVEVILNQWGVLVWEYGWWSWPHIWLILLVYIGGFYVLTLIFDRTSLKTTLILCCASFSAAVLCFLVFAKALEWI